MAKIFFSGIGGSGMSAIAGFMADRGHVIVGSDRSFDRHTDNHICRILEADGIDIVPQDGSGIDNSFDFAVFSTAVEDDHPEVIKARELGIPIKTRPRYLREIVDAYQTVAVAGTSGKSTTSGMLAFILNRIGMEPNFIGGGRVKQFRTERSLGNSLAGRSNLLVVEACESDGTIVDYRPDYSVIANLNLDHNPVEKTAGMFEALGRNTEERVIVNADDENLAQCRFDTPIEFSIDRKSAYQAEAIQYGPFGASFRLRDAPFRLSLPGKFNIYNALGCITVLSEMGIELRRIGEFLPEFSGIERRFDVRLNDGKHLVIDDYAHNPHKISSLMQSMGRIAERVCYVFQPHGFGPTRLMREGYIETFVTHLREEDHLFLLPIYYGGGTSVKDISSEDLSREIAAAGKSAEVLQKRSFLFNHVNEWNTYVVFGARDESLSDFAEEIAKRLTGTYPA
ncbi:MAG: Mur ligase family protein [Nitrospirota bacterium]